jgi:hypothetical protein
MKSSDKASSERNQLNRTFVRHSYENFSQLKGILRNVRLFAQISNKLKKEFAD